MLLCFLGHDGEKLADLPENRCKNYNIFTTDIAPAGLLCYTINMSKILIVGNVLKDVYLKLDEQQDGFEADERGINWLDLAFNGESHKFFKRTSVYGGAAVSLSILSQLGIDAAILNSNAELKEGEISWSNDPADYRYILNYKGGITYFVPSQRKATDWSTPKGTPEWILVDRSTQVSKQLVDEIQNFLKFSHGTKLAVHAEKRLTPDGQRLAEMADLLFVEDEPPMHREEKIIDRIELDRPNTQVVCHISPRKIALSDAEESWSLNRADMLTHLTVYSTIVATVLGVLARGGTPAEALLLARLNAEGATLEGALSADKLHSLAKQELEKRENLKLTTRLLLRSGRGILAIDESKPRLAKRFANFGVENNAAQRKEFYRIMATTPALKEYINGVLLSEENEEIEVAGQPLSEYLGGRGIILGIKADRGTKLLEHSEEWHSLGREDLAERLRGYYERGYRFAKWRAVFKLGQDQPGYIAMQENADELAHFAREAQLAGIVPVTEVSLVVDESLKVSGAKGNSANGTTGGGVTEGGAAENGAAEGEVAALMAREATALQRIMQMMFERMAERRVDPEACLVKCGMVLGGTGPRQIGQATAEMLLSSVPRNLAGVLLLSSGLEPKAATASLTALLQSYTFPWPVSFAFSTAFEEPVLATWKGDADKVKAAQATFERHLAANADALHYGRFEPREDRNGAVDIV